jgi:hypothetical protein
MADCTAAFSPLAPYEAYRCFAESATWLAVHHAAHRLVLGFAQTTIGAWVVAILVLALLAALLASFILPACLLGRLAHRSDATPAPRPAGRRERRLYALCGLSLLISGAIWIESFAPDRGVLILGTWQMICGTAVLLLGPSWWVPSEATLPTH